jgi:hypothetical protein
VLELQQHRVRRPSSGTLRRMARRRPERPPTAPGAQERDAASASVLPMEIAVGDRFTEHGHEWEVLTRPAHRHGGR